MDNLPQWGDRKQRVEFAHSHVQTMLFVYLHTLNQLICDTANSHVLGKLSLQNIWI